MAGLPPSSVSLSAILPEQRPLSWISAESASHKLPVFVEPQPLCASHKLPVLVEPQPFRASWPLLRLQCRDSARRFPVVFAASHDGEMRSCPGSCTKITPTSILPKCLVVPVACSPVSACSASFRRAYFMMSALMSATVELSPGVSR